MTLTIIAALGGLAGVALARLLGVERIFLKITGAMAMGVIAYRLVQWQKHRQP
jgi:uncharacterized membrane protein YebE (DUF533 family)